MFKRRPMGDLFLRCTTAVVLVVALFLCLYRLSLFYWVFVVAVFLWLSLWEWRHFFSFSVRQAWFYDIFLIVITAIYGFSAISLPFSTAQCVAFCILVFWTMVPLFLLSYMSNQWIFSSIISFWGAVCLLVAWLSVFWILRFFGSSPLLFVILLVLVMDSAAYFVGRWWGVTKLAEKISPHKSIEGLIGAYGGVWLVIRFLPPLFHGSIFHVLQNLTGAQTFCLSALFVLYGVCGDLLESACKRVAGKKDSGFLLPGHGGVLDRFDSYFAVMPLSFCLISLLF